MAVMTMSPREAFDALQKDAGTTLIDVRTPLEFAGRHAVGAVSAPLDGLNPAALMESLGGSKERQILLICKSGMRSAKAAQMFGLAGFGDVYSVEGGTDAWAAAGLPLDQAPAGAVSLGLQVRLVAVAIAVIGAALGYWVAPAFYFLAFIGAWIFFMSLTGYCIFASAIASVLAKMPWNRGKSAVCSTR